LLRPTSRKGGVAGRSRRGMPPLARREGRRDWRACSRFACSQKKAHLKHPPRRRKDEKCDTATGAGGDGEPAVGETLPGSHPVRLSRFQPAHQKLHWASAALTTSPAVRGCQDRPVMGRSQTRATRDGHNGETEGEVWAWISRQLERRLGSTGGRWEWIHWNQWLHLACESAGHVRDEKGGERGKQMHPGTSHSPPGPWLRPTLAGLGVRGGPSRGSEPLKGQEHGRW
jgi:hypothetical protein